MSINDIINNDNNNITKDNNTNKINTIDNTNNEKVNISIKSCKNITSKQALLIIPITNYFSNKYILNKLITVLKGESISLRLIDWFVTNYCKKFNVMYNLNEFVKSEYLIPNKTEINLFTNLFIKNFKIG